MQTCANNLVKIFLEMNISRNLSYFCKIFNTRHTYLDLLNNLKFDESDPILGSNKGELSCIFALTTGDNAEFNLRVDHGLHELVRDWLLDSTAPIS